MSQMPGDWPFCVVIVNMQKLDRSISDLAKRFSGGLPDSMINELIHKMPLVGEHVDLTRPVGFAMPTMGGQRMPVMWSVAPGAKKRFASLPNVKKEGDVHVVGEQSAFPYFVTFRGAYVVAAPTREILAEATGSKRSLAQVLGGRMKLMEGRDLYLHFAMEPVRAQALAGLAQNEERTDL